MQIHKESVKNVMIIAKIALDQQRMIALFVQMDLIFQNLFKNALNATNHALLALDLIIATANNVQKDTFQPVMVLLQLANYAKLDALNVLLNYNVKIVPMAFI